MKSPLTNLSKKLISSASSKGSNSSGFNLRDDFWDSFIQNGVRKALGFLSFEFFWWFCYEEQFLITVKSPIVKYLKTHLFKKKIAHCLFYLFICTNNLEGIFLLKKFFSGTWRH